MPNRVYYCNLPHFQKEGRIHFVTFCTRKREPLQPQSRQIVLECCVYEHNRRADIAAAAVMPDHVHLLLTLLHDSQGAEFSMSAVLQAIKGASVHKINRVLGRTGSLWQEESFDHVVRDSDALRQKIAYVINNPVRKGLVSKASEYRWVWTADPEFMSKNLA